MVVPPAIDELAAVFAYVDDRRTMRAFFDEIFTPAERRDLALRWLLMEELHRGVSQRSIARELGVSLCKITRGAKILKKRGSVTRRMLARGARTHGKRGATAARRRAPDS